MKTKTCKKCYKTKSASLFSVHPKMKDGTINICKQCKAEYARDRRHNPATRQAVLDSDKKHKSNNREKIKSYMMEYRQLDHVKLASIKSNAEYKKKYPDKIKAVQFLNRAVRRGEITRPDKCSICGHNCVPHGHHWSYDKDNWLDVIWVCCNCHVHIHAATEEAIPKAVGKLVDEEEGT